MQIRVIAVVHELENMPIRAMNDAQKTQLSDLVDKMLAYNRQFQKQIHRFITAMQSTFPNLERSRKIETGFELNFGNWRKELLRQKITIPIRDLLDYQELFEYQQQIVQNLQNNIVATNRQLDKMVYE